MKPNVIIALLVGGVIGFAVGKMVGPGANSGNTPTAAVAAPGAPGKPALAARGPGGDDQTVFKVPIDGAPLHGNVAAPVTIVEFSDYQCPFCGRANGTIKQIEDDYGQKVRVVMRQFPLSFHQNARPAALAALAAGEQGKYWEMHEKLFGNQNALDAASIEKYATELGLNLEKFKSDMQNQKLADIISRDQAAGSQVGVTGTPAFFINGRKISGAQPIQNFKTVIDQELAKAQSMVAAGTKPEAVYAAILEKAQNAPAPQAAPQAPPPPAVRNITVPSDAPFKGANPAKVTIVEWSDFQCPFCGRVEPTLKQIMDTYPNDVKLVWRNQPLPFHANAKPAAEAAMAANEQGKFWQMHDKLFMNQQALDRASMEKYAEEIGLDMNKFKAGLDSGKFRAAIEADSAAGNEAGANGTPTFYINGHQLVGAQPFPSFKAVIDEELAKANKLIAEGVKPQDVYARAIADGLKAAPAPAPAPAAAPPAPAKVVENIDISHAPVKGPKNAPVTIVEWSDFQCPFCSRAVPTLTEIEKQYAGKVKVAFKNQPLPFHQNARLAANAAMAANEQGKFWEMHDKLFANQQALDRASIEKYAQEIGLNMSKFKSALDTNKFDADISKDSTEGMQAGANGTPTFFINGRMLVGAQPIDQFKAIIDDELKKKH